ncbi:uncharacterized protein [Oscarella lobularis]|uniref:uncharacterized protein n=1 Tax=Oscarella lobularis TaxID=121494 RepID=UPI0033132636
MVSLLVERLHRQRLDNGDAEPNEVEKSSPSYGSVVQAGATAIDALIAAAASSQRKRKRSNSTPSAIACHRPVETTWTPDPTASAWSPIKRTKKISTSFDSSDDGFFSASSPLPPPPTRQKETVLLRSTSQPCVSGVDAERRASAIVVRPWSSGSAAATKRRHHRERPHVNFAKMVQSRSDESIGFRLDAKADIDFWSSAGASIGPPSLPFAFGDANESADVVRDDAFESSPNASYSQDALCELDLSKIEEN